MANFKITVTKLREGNTGNVEYKKEQLSEFSSTLKFSEPKMSMGDMVSFYSYDEVSEIIVSGSEKDSEISRIESRLSGHITFDIKVEEVNEKTSVEAKKLNEESINAKGKNTYKVSWFNMQQGKNYEAIVNADSEQEAEVKVNCNQNCKVELVEKGTVAVEHIIDAEELLFNMDAEGVDEITTKEGMNGKVSETYTRKQVEAYLFSKKTASQKAKELGFRSLKQVQEISGRTQQYLDDCSKKRPNYYEILLHGCLWKLSL